MKRVPIYNVRTWKIRAADSQRIVFRPSLRTFAIRLQATVIFFALVGLLEISGGHLLRHDGARTSNISATDRDTFAAQEAEVRESIRREFGDAFMERVDERVDEQRAERQRANDAAERRVESVEYWLKAGRFVLYGFLALCGVLPPLSCLWSRVSVHRDALGSISVFALALLPRRRAWTHGHFKRIRTNVMERFWFGRYNFVTKHAWDWYVQITPAGLPNMPITMTAAWGTSGEDLPPQFLVHRQKHEPGNQDLAPEPVRDFVKAMRALTGLPPNPPQIVPARLHRGFWGTRVTRSAPLVDVSEVSRQTHTYRSLDEMPPDVRAQLA